MLQVRLDQQQYEYDIHSLVKAFYPTEDVKVEVENRAGIELDRHTIGIAFMGGTAQDETVITILNQDGMPREYRQKTGDKDDFKKFLYQSLSDFTGKELPWGNLTGIRPTKLPMGMFEEGKSEEEILSWLKDRHLVSEEKALLSIDIAKRERKILSELNYDNGYSLYIGIPFCPTTCLYCSFTSYPLCVWKNRIGDYLQALFREIEFTGEAMKDRELDTVYIGGGTPTTLEPEHLAKLLAKIRETFDFSHVKEFTVEAGRADSITREKLEVLKEYGVGRISVNPQTMHDKTLKLIGRQHTVAQVEEAFHLARELGFDNINMDLILGLPQEDINDVRNTMEQLKALDPDNITIHSLAIKRAARLNIFKDHYKDMQMINTQEHMDLCAEYCRDMGLSPYYLYRQKGMAGNMENVGYAKEGKAGVYNILIMEEKQTIMALGAGATTKFVLPEHNDDGSQRIERVENVKDVKNYLERIDEMIDRKIRKMEEVGWH